VRTIMRMIIKKTSRKMMRRMVGLLGANYFSTSSIINFLKFFV
jgi:hypothetical protein